MSTDPKMRTSRGKKVVGYQSPRCGHRAQHSSAVSTGLPVGDCRDLWYDQDQMGPRLDSRHFASGLEQRFDLFMT
jgi:hypothetical protein